MTIVFVKYQPKITHMRSQIQVFSLFQQLLQLDKFEDADFKYNKIIFKFQP